MEKEKNIIDKKSKNKKIDEKILIDRNVSYEIANIVSSILFMTFYMLETHLFNRNTTALLVIFLGTWFSVMLTRFIKSKQKWFIFPLICMAAFLIWLIILYFMKQ